jgi:outer membrane receptor protein involved in Fe transport
MLFGQAAAVLVVLALGTQSTQTGQTLRGVVRDEQGGSIADATVQIVCGPDHRRATTDRSGEFAATGLPAAKCEVTASAPLFAARTIVVDLTRRPANTTLTLGVREFATSVVVTPARGTREETASVPESISVVTRQQLDGRPFHLLPQVLREEPGILLQQTTTAQTSPIIRGFTGQSNVYLLDGVRFNTASWRGGPSQYLGWIDSAAIDRLEIVRGSGSVLFGSDALGGTINVLTNRPSLLAGGVHVGGDVQLNLGSADQSAGGEADLIVQGRAAAFRFGASTERVRDLRTGRGIDSHAAVTRFLGLPSSVVGARLPRSGFDQSGASVLGTVRAGESATLSTVFLHEKQSGASRYDRIAGGDGLYRSGFTPQTLDFGSIRYRRLRVAGFEDVSAAFSVNRQDDGRFEQTRPTAVLDQQRAMTTALGYQLEGHRRAGRHHLFTVGTELYDETVSASREQINPLTSVSVRNRPDIPDGTAYSNLGVFVQDAAELAGGRLSVRGGLRYGRFAFRSITDPLLGVVEERVTTHAVTFSAGTLFAVTKQLNATFNVNRGFRAPNSADLGSIGLTGGGGFEVAPSRAASLGGFIGSTGATGAVSSGASVPQLGPEVLYSFEPGVKFHGGRFGGSFSVFDIEYLNSIQRRAVVFNTNVVGTTIAGYEIVRQDATGLAYIAQDIRPLATRANVDRGRIVGFDVEGTVQMAPQWNARAFMSRSDGTLLGTGEYMRRMPPPLGGASARWSGARTWLEGVVSFASAQTRFNSGDLTDARIGGTRTRGSIAGYFNGTATDAGLVRNGVLVATGETLAQVQSRLLGTAASGTLYDRAPGFVVFGARAGVRLGSQVELTLLGENLTDRNYRLYGSGVDAPGVNVQMRARYRFP